MASWFGSSYIQPIRYNNNLPPAPEPVVFNPLELSGCVLWLDANDSDSVNVVQDPGGNLNRVLKWFDKAQPSNRNYYTHIGSPSGSGLYNTHYMNQLRTVYFQPNTAMDHEGGGVAFNFQDRTFFAVIKPLTDLTGPSGPILNVYNGFYDTGAMNVGIAYSLGKYQYVMCENGIQCGVIFDMSNNPLNNRVLFSITQSSTDLSGNNGTYDTISQPLTASFLASSYFTGKTQYVLNDPNKAVAQDIAEIIMYNRVLLKSERQQVLDYLADKWGAQGPTPPTI